MRTRMILFAAWAIVLPSITAKSQTLPPMHTVTVASGLSRPVFVTSPPGDYERLFIVENQVQISNQWYGRIRILKLRTGDLITFLTLAGIANGNEQGLLGLAFDPDYSNNGKFYIHYTAASFGDIRVVQYQASGDVADPASAKTVISFPHPQANHNAGWIGFSSRANDDHNLYISSGDGGNGNDADGNVGHHEPGGNAQWNQTLLGKMLRIHIDPTTGLYTYPMDNPFFGQADPIKKEIWLLGLRNPYRDSFDRLTGRLFMGDVGQDTREEVDVQQPTNPGGGENYGWRDREGLIQNPAYPTPTASPTPTSIPPRVDPILDYPRSGSPPAVPISGSTVTGGYVYRGQQIPGLLGTYIFGDYSARKIFSVNYDGTTGSNKQTITSQLFPTIDNPPVNLGNPSSFGEDANGELYICDLATGKVYKIVPVTPNVKITSITRDLGSNNIVIEGVGVPFTSVSLETTLSMTQPFGDPVPVAIGGDGVFSYTDASNLGMRFYRVKYP